MKTIMTNAWEIAKEAAKKFGGKAIEYIVCSTTASGKGKKFSPLNSGLSRLSRFGSTPRLAKLLPSQCMLTATLISTNQSWSTL